MNQMTFYKNYAYLTNIKEKPESGHSHDLTVTLF